MELDTGENLDERNKISLMRKQLLIAEVDVAGAT
jgi:hypothetical protein